MRLRKTKWLLISFHLFCCSFAYSQHKVTYQMGLAGGLSACQIRTPSLDNSSGLLWQYNIGATLEQQFSSKFMLVYELKYARAGSRDKTTSQQGNDVLFSKYNYLTLPILARLRSKGERAFIELGGQAGYFLGGKSYFASKEDQANNLQNVYKLDLGLVGGIGFRLSHHFLVDARYYHGLKKIYEDISTIDPTTGSPVFYKSVPQHHRIWSLNLAYYF